jgi:hypothetical protein
LRDKALPSRTNVAQSVANGYRDLIGSLFSTATAAVNAGFWISRAC